jgi:hypothetical protein
MSTALDVFTLGGLRIRLEHERLEHLRSRAAEGLFVYLVCQGRPRSRERLAESSGPNGRRRRPWRTSVWRCIA